MTERTLLAHGVWLDDEELDLIAARGATVVSNPAANMKLAVGKVFDWPSARAAGVRVGLGTDGAGSNDSLDLLADLKLFALAQRHAAADADRDRRRRRLGDRHRRQGAAARRHPARGRRARRLPPPRPDRAGAGDRRPRPPTSSTPPTAARVDTVVVGGRVLMRGGVQPERDEVVAKAAERAARLGL